MGKRKEVAFEEKVSLVEEYLAGRLRMREAARRAGVGHTTMESWISRYRSEGISALEENGNRSKRKYSEDFKRQVAEEYLSGQGSSMAIAEKYHLRSGNLVLDWVKAYHERNSKRERGGTIMRNDHTIEERLEAVLACLEGGPDAPRGGAGTPSSRTDAAELGEKVSGVGSRGIGGPAWQAPGGPNAPEPG